MGGCLQSPTIFKGLSTWQRGRNYRFYTEYGMRKEYASIANFLRKRSFIDMDYVYGTLSDSDGECPLDYAAAMADPMEYFAVATEAETGRAKYFDKRDLAQDDYSVCKASSAIPFVCHPYPVGGTLYYDGALSDPVPVRKAFELGCERVVLLLTLPEATVRTPDKDEKFARRIRRKYPQAAQGMVRRAARYNDSVTLARELAAEGKVLIVSPDDTCGVSTLTRDVVALENLYVKGFGDGRKIAAFL